MTGQPHRAKLSAGWAIWGKRPGTSGDYGVIEFSKEPGLHDYQYDEIVRYFSVGTPPTGRDLAGSLPWVTISTMTVNELRYVGMAIKEPTADVDAAGRPITRTRFFCVPYRPFADGRVGYFTLYRALAASELPVPGRDQVRLSVLPLDPEALAEEIVTELGEAAVTLTAALLLRGAVTVVGASDATLDQRLRFIDAVTALLPYGFRAASTAATWSDSVAPDTIRLAFAAWPRESTGVVRWHAAQPPPVDDDVAAHYYKELRRLRDDQPGTGRLASIIEFLVRDTTPRLFDRSNSAVESLRDFDLPYTVLADIRQGLIRTAEVRRVLTSGLITELPSGGRQDLLAALIKTGDPADLTLAADWWQEAVIGSPDLILGALTARARDFLWRPAPDEKRARGFLRRPSRDEKTVRTYLEFAGAHGLADGLLARLILPTANSPGPATEQAALVRLVVGWLLAGHDPAPFTQTRDALANNAALACTVLARLAGEERLAVTALDWLRPALGSVVEPFTIALISGPAIVTRPQVSLLVQHDPTCVQLLLDAAVATGRLDWVLPGFAEWMAASLWRGAGSSASAARIAATWLESLRPSEASGQAWIDLIRLIDGTAPRYLLAPQSDPGRYCAVFAAGWDRLVGQQSYYDIEGRLADSLTNYLRGAAWAESEVQAATVTSIVDLLTAQGRRPGLRDRVADTVPGPVEKALRVFRLAASRLRGESHS